MAFIEESNRELNVCGMLNVLMGYFGSGKNINYSFLRVLNILEEICVVFNRLVRARDFKIIMMFLDINHNEDPQF